MKKLLMIFVALALVFTTVTFGCAKNTAPEKVKKDISNVKKDVKKAAPKTEKAQKMVFVSSTEKAEACATCHVKISADKDYSLSAEVAKLKGHPKVTANTVADCLKCHNQTGYPEFKKVIHGPHYKQGSVFVKNYKGSCVHCHKLTESGSIQVPGIDPKATYQTIEVAQVDKAPEGCASCHKKFSADKDYSLPKMIDKIQGHPNIGFNDFNLCYACHNGQKAPYLGLVLHKKHLNNGTYKKNYGNSCLNCHKLKNGEVILKGKKATK